MHVRCTVSVEILSLQARQEKRAWMLLRGEFGPTSAPNRQALARPAVRSAFFQVENALRRTHLLLLVSGSTRWKGV